MTSTATTWSDQLTAAQALHRLAPTAGEVLGQLAHTVAARADLVALVRWECADAQELTPLPAPRGAELVAATVVDRSWEELPDEQRTVLRFAEQFSVDVSGLDEDLRASLWSVLGETPRKARGRLLAMMWVADLTPRVLATLDRLFRSPGSTLPAGTEDRIDDATPLAHEFVRVVHALHEVDPVLSDLVRLRGAHAHNCRLCKSLRSRSALAAGATLDDFDGGGDYLRSGLPTASTVALSLVDAMLWYPARIPEDVLHAVREHFTPAQAVEIVLDVMRNAWNKTTVAAELDEAHVDGIEVYQYHDDGSVEFALDAPDR